MASSFPLVGVASAAPADASSAATSHTADRRPCDLRERTELSGDEDDLDLSVTARVVCGRKNDKLKVSIVLYDRGNPVKRAGDTCNTASACQAHLQKKIRYTSGRYCIEIRGTYRAGGADVQLPVKRECLTGPLPPPPVPQ